MKTFICELIHVLTHKPKASDIEGSILLSLGFLHSEYDQVSGVYNLFFL